MRVCLLCSGVNFFFCRVQIAIKDIIEGAQKREQQKSGRRKGRLLRTVINIAAVFGMLCFMTTLLAFSVSPVRIALKDYLLTKNDEYLDKLLH